MVDIKLYTCEVMPSGHAMMIKGMIKGMLANMKWYASGYTWND